jgi:16S rRNA (guanine966-N2)-methyltransferase
MVTQRSSHPGASTPRPPAGRSTANAPQLVRIIGGQWKRTPLPVPAKAGLRPTPNRVRETLFNWLGQDLSGWRCCDAFAGSGALGLEAASRGAAQVWLVEQDAALASGLGAMCTKLKASGVKVHRGDGVALLRSLAGQGLDAVFLDPPFGDDGNEALFASALRAAAQAIGPQGLVYLESPRVWAADELAPLGLASHKQGKAGMVCYALLGPLSV